jgi:uncharacterized membrane protein YphA (DoxX/SURF4 family)
MKAYAPKVLRIGIALVFLWFGVNQILSQDLWVGYVPDFVQSLTSAWFGMSATTLVVINGAFEVVFGLCLLFGIYIRLSATLLALHMAGIVFSVGWSATGARDFGIAVATIAIALYGKE